MDPLGQGVGIERAVQDDDPLREELRQLLVAGRDALVEAGVFTLDPVGLGADARGEVPGSIASTNVRSAAARRWRAG